MLKLLVNSRFLKCYVSNRRMMAGMTSKKNLVAVCQMTATNNKEENLRICLDLIKKAKEQKCEMVFLPEAFDYIGESKQETLAMAESLEGNTIKEFQNIATEKEIWLSLGGFHEKESSEKVMNSHVVIDDIGRIVVVYRKTHLFDVNLEDQGIRLMESDYVISGKCINSPVETPVGRVGLAICYDMRFPEFSLSLAKNGADILTFPSAFTYVTGAAHWETILRARAIESQCYVIAAAQTGTHNAKRTSWGHAMIVDPWGSIIAQCTDGTGVAIAEINLDYIKDIRSSMPVWKHRRNDIYRELAQERANDGHSWKILESYKAIAFMSNNAIIPGHVLVRPIRNVTKVSDLNGEEIPDVFLMVRVIQKLLQDCYNVSASTVYIKESSDEQLYVHVLPRRPCDFPKNDVIYQELEKHEEAISPSRETELERRKMTKCVEEMLKQVH